MSGAVARCKVLYVFSRTTRAEHERLLEHRDAPDDLLYGYLKLSSAEFATQSITRCLDEWTWRRYVALPLELMVARQVRMGFALSFARDHLVNLRAADVIVTTVDTVGLPIAWLKRRRMLAAPLVYISQGLTDRLERLPAHSRRRQFWQALYGKMVRVAERVVVFGDGAAEPLQRLLRVEDQRLAVVPFGVDGEFWQPGKGQTGRYVLSVGSDAARDYGTLVAAANARQLHIVTRLPVAQPAGHSTIAVGSHYSDVELRDLYQQADYVVTPLKDVAQPSGQSATLQAMACGKAVILTRTRGLWDRQIMRDRVNCCLVAPADVRSLRAAMEWLETHPGERQRIGLAARETVERYFTSRHVASAMAENIHEALRHH